jgi:hypothetical protein
MIIPDRKAYAKAYIIAKFHCGASVHEKFWLLYFEAGGRSRFLIGSLLAMIEPPSRVFVGNDILGQ